jgi:hypothetical protein
VEIVVDESGGTSGDYFVSAALAPKELESRASALETSLLPIPAGASVKIKNAKDPNGNNTISVTQFFSL